MELFSLKSNNFEKIIVAIALLLIWAVVCCGCGAVDKLHTKTNVKTDSVFVHHEKKTNYHKVVTKFKTKIKADTSKGVKTDAQINAGDSVVIDNDRVKVSIKKDKKGVYHATAITKPVDEVYSRTEIHANSEIKSDSAALKKDAKTDVAQKHKAGTAWYTTALIIVGILVLICLVWFVVKKYFMVL